MVSLTSVTVAYNTIQAAVSGRLDHTETLSAIADESEVTKARFEAYAQVGDSMMVEGYYCNPNAAPMFDPRPWARSEGPLKVKSQDGYTAGVVNPDGTYKHFGYCAK